ncbi:MAG: hypothetical protein ACKVQV_11390, partial [Bacteroidia bacterium]
MQEQSNVEKKLNDYFELARNEAPIVSSEEVAHVITNMSISNSNKYNWKFHSTWLAVVGLSITIYTAYFLNQKNLESKKSNNKEQKNTEL